MGEMLCAWCVVSFGCVLLTFSVPVHATTCPPCGSNAACHNTVGACTCNCGYHGDPKNCTATDPPLGVSNPTVLPDSQMTASSTANDSRYGPRKGRLHGPSAWCAMNNATGEYLQIDLQFPRLLSRIATQGQRSVSAKASANYVVSYKLRSSIDGVTWNNYTHKNGPQTEKVFAGNADSNSVVCHVLNESTRFIARYVRLYPQSSYGRMCLRLELYGGNDECSQQTNTCPVNVSCVNTESGHTCFCGNGFDWNGVNCTDKDECTLGIHNCPFSVTCVNAEGSYTCACGEGMRWDGSNCTSCPAGHRANGGNCEDIDECGEELSSCSTFAKCLNTIGSHNCSCKNGFTGDGFNCSDLDECSLGTAHCNYNAVCSNTNGSYYCSCKAGFVDDEVLVCKDVNECSASKCHLHSSCVNTPGSYLCQCDKGFSDKGTACIDVDECAQPTNNCHRNADCDNTNGSYRCTCRQGYVGNGVECTTAKTSKADNNPLEAVLKQHKVTFISSFVVLGAALVCVAVFVFYRRKRRVRKKMRPPTTTMGQVDQMDDDLARWRDSASLHSSFFSIPSLHPSTLSLNNIVLQNSQPRRTIKRGLQAAATSGPTKPRILTDLRL